MFFFFFLGGGGVKITCKTLNTISKSKYFNNISYFTFNLFAQFLFKIINLIALEVFNFIVVIGLKV